MSCCFDLTDIIQHFASAFAAALGGLSMLVYLQPSTIKEALVRVLVSVGAGTTMAPAITKKIFDDPVSDVHVLAGVAFGVGFLSWSVLGSVARYFEHRREKDAAEMIGEIKK